jgi:hypothetical protein
VFEEAGPPRQGMLFGLGMNASFIRSKILLGAKPWSQRIEVDISTAAIQNYPKCPRRRRRVRASDFLDQMLIGASRNGSSTMTMIGL